MKYFMLKNGEVFAQDATLPAPEEGEEISSPPSHRHAWDSKNKEWKIPPRQLGNIDSEMNRRLNSVISDIEHRELTSHAVMVLSKPESERTDGDLAVIARSNEICRRFAVIRQAASALIAQNPIPQDFTADSHWQEPEEGDE